jgi:hypothetical protein
MTDVTVHLKVAGVLLISLAAAHPFFPAQFGWKEDLAKLTLLNRQIFLVHSFFIALTVAMMGCLALFLTPRLLDGSPLARAVLGGLALFWGARLLIQLFVYDRRLWRGDPFRTCVHVAFTCLWLYLTVVFSWALRQAWWR